MSAFKKFDDSIIRRLKGTLLKAMRIRPNVVILMYHGIVSSSNSIKNWSFLDAESFLIQMRYLKKYFEIIPLSETKERLNSQSEKPAAVITFDDGYQNNYDLAFPILQKYKIPATIFLTTGKINTSDTLHVCRLHNAFETTEKNMIDWNDSRYTINKGNKVDVQNRIKNKLKRLPNKQLGAEVRQLILKLGSDPDQQIPKDSPYRMLDQESIKKMINSGLIDFGAHTHSHAILSRLSYDEQRNEIEQSINEVKMLTNKPCKFFAYPNGCPQDFNSDTIEILRSLGVEIAVTTIAGINKSATSPHELRRYGIGQNMKLSSFKYNVHQIKPFIKEKLMLKTK